MAQAIFGPAIVGGYRDRFLQHAGVCYLFNTAQQIWVVDKSGNNIEGFPLKLQSPATNGVAVVDFDDTLWGWTIGAGIEYAITNNITTRVEYRYTQFDSQDNGFNFTGLVGSGNTEPEFHTVRAGISYKF